jgi:putative transposase
MARQLRVEYPGAVYHVMFRANRGEMIFTKDGQRKACLRCDKVLGSEGIFKDTAWCRREFETGMEGRFMEILEGVEDDELKEKWKNIRRGWYLGDRQFRQFLEKLVEAAASESRRDGFAGDGILFHDQAAARKKCRQALKALNLTLGELRKTPKNDERKLVIAWYLRSKTVIDRAFVSEMLCMGHPSTVSRAVTLVN